LHLHWSDGKVYDDDAADSGEGGAEGGAESGSTRQNKSGLARGMSLLKSILKDKGMTASNMPKELRLWLLLGFGVQGFRDSGFGGLGFGVLVQALVPRRSIRCQQKNLDHSPPLKHQATAKQGPKRLKTFAPEFSPQVALMGG
jgi:hypothetical protein